MSCLVRSQSSTHWTFASLWLEVTMRDAFAGITSPHGVWRIFLARVTLINTTICLPYMSRVSHVDRIFCFLPPCHYHDLLSLHEYHLHMMNRRLQPLAQHISGEILYLNYSWWCIAWCLSSQICKAASTSLYSIYNNIQFANNSFAILEQRDRTSWDRGKTTMTTRDVMWSALELNQSPVCSTLTIHRAALYQFYLSLSHLVIELLTHSSFINLIAAWPSGSQASGSQARICHSLQSIWVIVCICY